MRFETTFSDICVSGTIEYQRRALVGSHGHSSPVCFNGIGAPARGILLQAARFDPAVQYGLCF